MNKTPILLIGAVLAIAVIGGLLFYNYSKATPTPNTANTSTNSPPKPKPQNTIPPNAPPGAQPPEQTGSPSAAVTLEEFADLQCSSCAKVHPTINEIKGIYGSRIHFIFRNFPLQIPQHDKSYEAALAASAAGMQNKFWDMQNMLFSNQKAWTTDQTYKQIWKGYAQKIGLDVAKWENDMGGMAVKGRVEADMARGKAINVNSTPSIYVNGVSVHIDDVTLDGLKKLIDAELQKGSPQNPASSAPPANTGNSTK